jgi:hypothetical protein
MRDHSIPNGLCSIDPITAGVAALSGIAGSLFGGGGGGSAPAATPAEPKAPPPAAPPESSPTGQKAGGAKTSTPSFLGAAATPTATAGQKTLLGQ